jgi:hypothetical protein
MFSIVLNTVVAEEQCGNKSLNIHSITAVGINVAGVKSSWALPHVRYHSLQCQWGGCDCSRKAEVVQKGEEAAKMSGIALDNSNSKEETVSGVWA